MARTKTGDSPWLLPVLLNAGFLQGAVYVVRPMVTYKAVDMGADPWLVGIVGATFALAPFIFAIQIGRWIDRGNAGRALFYGTLIALAASVGLIFVENITLLLLAMPVLGIGHLLVMSGGQTMTGNLSIDRNYEKNFGLLTFYASLGHAAGPFLGGLVADRGDLAVDVDSAFLLASLSFLVAAIVIWPLFETKRPVSGTKEKIPKGKVSEVFAIRSFGSAIFVSGSVTAVIDVMLVFLPLLGRELGFSVTQVGILLAVRAVASMMVRLVLEPISTRFGMRVTLNFGTVFTIVATVAIAITGNYLVMAVLMFIVGFASGIGQPLTMAWVSRISRPEIRGLAISIRLTSNRLGQVVLPALAGVLAASGAGTIFWLLAGMQGLSLVVTEKSLGKGKNGNTETDTEAE